VSTARIPLVGEFNQRSVDGVTTLASDLDQRFLNCIFTVVKNPITGSDVLYVEKRPGVSVDTLVDTDEFSTGLLKPQSLNSTISGFGSTNSIIYVANTSVGTITGQGLHFSETLIGSTSYILIKSSDGTGWFFAEDAADDLTYVGDTHNGTAIIDSLDNTTGMYVGQAISGTGIPADTRILTVDSATQITANTNSSADGTDITITKTPVAKIIDADFATTTDYVSALVPMDGYLFYTTSDGKVNNGNLNSVTAYTAIDFLSAQMYPDPTVALVRSKNTLAVFGTASTEVFKNVGNANGSPLQSIPEFSNHIGANNQLSVVTLEDDVYFVGTSQYGDIQVFRLKNFQSEKISTPTIDRILGTQSTSGGVFFVGGFQLGGYKYVVVTIGSVTQTNDNLLLEGGDDLLLETGDLFLLEGSSTALGTFERQLVYNVDLNLWSEWDCEELTFVVGQGAGSYNKLLMSSRFLDDGYIYKISPASDSEVYADNGTNYDMEIRTSRVNFGTSKRKFISAIKLICDELSSGTVTLEASDDNYVTWKTLGTFDLTTAEPKITRCGSHKGGRAYRLTHSTDSFFRAEALEIDYVVEKEKTRNPSTKQVTQ
jgi:hypothetical protein